MDKDKFCKECDELANAVCDLLDEHDAPVQIVALAGVIAARLDDLRHPDQALGELVTLIKSIRVTDRNEGYEIGLPEIEIRDTKH